jgi:enoyl-CoA hydratase
MVAKRRGLLPEIGRRDLMIGGAGAALLAAGMGADGIAEAQTGPRPVYPPASAPPGKIDVERRGAILLIGLNRSEADNRADAPMLIGLGKAFYQFEHDDDLRVAVLHAIGPNFCPGLDVPAVAAAIAAGTYPSKDSDAMSPANTRPPFRTKPVVVAAQGKVGAIGHEMFLAADVRVAASDARFGQQEVARGVFPGAGATIRMTREAGWGNAMRYILTSEEWGAEEGYRLGLVQEVTAPGKQLDRALEFAGKIAANAPLGVRAALASAHQAISSEDTALAALLPAFAQILQSEDAKESLRAVQEGRRPVFQGR